ncbi:hypothetical protein JCM17960_17750 [Magnetospira thiophila]
MNPIELALRYPYGLPHSSYVLTAAGPQPWTADVCLEGRTPVLAVGANQASERLAMKFPELRDREQIPVQRGTLDGFDAVYSAHFSVYGSIPATLHPLPGGTVTLCVTWLTQAQLPVMHQSEAVGKNYDFVVLEGACFRSEQGTEVPRPFTYLSRRGAWAPEGLPIGLAAVSATGRPYGALTQMQVQELARLRLSPRDTLGSFVAATIDDRDLRQSRTARLAEQALPPQKGSSSVSQ